MTRILASLLAVCCISQVASVLIANQARVEDAASINTQSEVV